MNDDAPPPYSLSESGQGSSSSASTQTNPRFLTSYLNTHIAALPKRIRQNQQVRNAQQVETDIWILDHLAPILESFLADLGTHQIAPAFATLIMVPDSAIPPDAKLSGIEDMFKRRDEVGRIFRVKVQRETKGKRDSINISPPSTEKESPNNRKFTDWGRWDESESTPSEPSELLWWKDEELARRLASYLQPPSRPKSETIIQSPVQVAAERIIPAERTKKGWSLGWRRSNASTCESSPKVSLPVSSESSQATPPGIVEAGDALRSAEAQLDNDEVAKMNVAVEKLAFRHENDFGIWESISGWAIIVTIITDSP